MRIAIFSDIHGNIHSFRGIMRSIATQDVDLKIFCGDICGYYYGQNEVIDILAEVKDLLMVKGNHDELFVRSFSDTVLRKECVEKFGRSYEVMVSKTSNGHLDFIADLPEKIEVTECGLFVCHGSPWDFLEEYVYPDDDISRFEGLGYRYVVMGHTHYPMGREIGGVLVLNPGSCGQPRDFNVPSYMILDTGRVSFEIKRCPYDMIPLKREIEKYDAENMYLRDVLDRSQK